MNFPDLADNCSACRNLSGLHCGNVIVSGFSSWRQCIASPFPCCEALPFTSPSPLCDLPVLRNLRQSGKEPRSNYQESVNRGFQTVVRDS